MILIDIIKTWWCVSSALVPEATCQIFGFVPSSGQKNNQSWNNYFSFFEFHLMAINLTSLYSVGPTEYDGIGFPNSQKESP